MHVYEPILVSNRECLQMDVLITLEYSKRFDMPLDDVIDLFESNGIYDLLDRGREEYITKTAGYMAYHIKARIEEMAIGKGKVPRYA